MKILFVSNEPNTVILEEMLYHGLITKFWRDEVIDYPFNAYFHGGTVNRSHIHIYHRFHDPNPVYHNRDQVKAMKDSFDLVIIGSQRKENRMPEKTADVLSWGFSCPVVCVDGEDSPYGPQIHGGMYNDERIKLYFKSEFYPEFSKLEKTRPLPGAIYGEEGCEVERNRPISVLCSLQKNNRQRNEIFPIISKIPDSWVNDAPWEVSYEDYEHRVCSSKIGISARGHAWLCHAYWRIPLYGCVLLSQKSPIIIPDNFVDWESAAFFDSPNELPKIIEMLLQDDSMRIDIAKKGRELVRSKHMSVHRVEYLLKCVREVCTGTNI